MRLSREPDRMCVHAACRVLFPPLRGGWQRRQALTGGVRMLLSTEALDPPPPPSAAPSPEGEEDPCPLIFSVNTCDLGSPELREDRLPTTCCRRHPAKSDPTDYSPRRRISFTTGRLMHRWISLLREQETGSSNSVSPLAIWRTYEESEVAVAACRVCDGRSGL